MKKFISKHWIISHGFFSLVVALVLTSIAFKGIRSHEFLFIGDEFLILSKYELWTLSFMRNARDLGLLNGLPLLINFFERLYYFFLYSFHIPLFNIEFFGYFLKLFLSIFIPFLGFLKLSRIYLKNTPVMKIFVLSLWYSFNTYTLLNWNGSFFFTSLITYSLAPLALYLYHQAVFEKTSIVNILKAALILFLFSFALYLSAVFYILLLIYTIFLLLLQKNKLMIIKNIAILALLSVPLFLPFFILISSYLRNAPAISVSLENSTAGILSGGVLYQLILWSQWPIYVYWAPRNGLTFYRYLQSFPYLFTPFLLYGLIFVGLLKKKRNIITMIFLTCLLVFLLFAKGPQGPFGEIYNFFINHVPIFVLFRSPDNKFGFGIILASALLLLITLNNYKRNLFIPLLLFIILIQSYPVFTGTAIRGENVKNISSDRIIQIPSSYSEVINFINKNNNPYGYVITFPSEAYHIFKIYNNKLFIGQDLLSKQSVLPYIYLSERGGVPEHIYVALNNPSRNGFVEALSQLPIRYVILRKDILKKPVNKDVAGKITKTFPLVFRNDIFQIYENKNVLPLIQSQNITFEEINPISYNIKFQNVRDDQKLYFYQTFDTGWKIYPSLENESSNCKFFTYTQSNVTGCIHRNEVFINLNDLTNINNKPLFETTHKVFNGYANSWEISPKQLLNSSLSRYVTINKDKSINFTLTLYYHPQSYFYLTTLISIITFLIYLGYILLTIIIKNV